MKTIVLLFLTVAVVLVGSSHTFLGTNVMRPLLYHVDAKFGSKLFQKRIEYVNYTIPHLPAFVGRYIQGILAYDKTNTGASCNVTEGGVGANYVKLRMKSDRGEKLNYDIYIYG